MQHAIPSMLKKIGGNDVDDSFATAELRERKQWLLIWENLQKRENGQENLRLFIEGATSGLEAWSYNRMPLLLNLLGRDDFTRDMERLIRGGAILERTEDEKLYRKNGKIVAELVPIGKQIMSEADPETAYERHKKEVEEIYRRMDIMVEKRDRFIAGRINIRLLSGETGLLIIGAGHRVQDFLEPDIEIRLVSPELGAELREHRGLQGLEGQYFSRERAF